MEILLGTESASGGLNLQTCVVLIDSAREKTPTLGVPIAQVNRLPTVPSAIGLPFRSRQ
jgi:hypothetical protein